MSLAKVEECRRVEDSLPIFVYHGVLKSYAESNSSLYHKSQARCTLSYGELIEHCEAEVETGKDDIAMTVRAGGDFMWTTVKGSLVYPKDKGVMGAMKKTLKEVTRLSYKWELCFVIKHPKAHRASQGWVLKV